MTPEEFRAWLGDEVEGGRVTQSQRKDLEIQQTRFALHFGTAEDPRPERDAYRLNIVGYVADQLRVAREIHALIGGAKSEFPGRMVYFEPIGFDLF